MPDAPLPARPWLDGLVACATRVEARVVRELLAVEGTKPRSVPAGRAAGAWTWVRGRHTLAVCASGRGPDAARRAASFWAPRARAIVVVGARGSTGLLPSGTLVAAGDPALLGSARAAAPGDLEPLVEARIASTAAPPAGQAARASLAAAGIAAVDGETETWLEAAAMLGVPALGLHAAADPPDLHGRLRALRADGSAGRPLWRTLGDLLVHPADLLALRRDDVALAEAVRPAARLALAALLDRRTA